MGKGRVQAGWMLGAAITLGCAAVGDVAPWAIGQSAPAEAAMPVVGTDPAIAAVIGSISADNVRADIAKLVSFGTRNTLSSTAADLPAGQGILPAADWIASEFGRISAGCGGCLDVKRDDYIEPASSEPRSRVKQPTRLVNIYAVMHGTADPKTAPWVLVTGHYDSRATDVLDPKAAAPGANDDASGVAVSLESARVLSKLKFSGTIVFVAVAGEEQGLLGALHLARLAKSEGWPLEAVLNNDIVGGDTTPGDTQQDKNLVRVFSENVPSAATPEAMRATLALGAENDSPSRELARTIAEIAPAYLRPGVSRPPPVRNGARSMALRQTPAFHPVLVLRRDRYLRGGDHTSFNAEGFAAVRFTEWRENFDHQHQTPRTENGTDYGDFLRFVDPDYVVNVARLNAAVLATLAGAPSEPQNVRVLTAALDNNSELTWAPSAYAPEGTTYEVVWRETDEMAWTHAASAGSGTHLKLNVSKDNVLFGVRAVAPNGDRSLPVPPVPAR